MIPARIEDVSRGAGGDEPLPYEQLEHSVLLENMLPGSVRSGFFRLGKAGPRPARRRTGVRRTSEAWSNVAGAKKVLLNDPGEWNQKAGYPKVSANRSLKLSNVKRYVCVP